jgi:uridine phosphorylase
METSMADERPMPGRPPILRAKRYADSSVFAPENLLREARRQRNIPAGQVPRVCILDPDGDIVRNLRAHGRATLQPHWACYHTQMDVFTHNGIEYGIVGCAVGAPFAVLVAEEMFASGCELLISVTSSGRITAHADPPYFVLIQKALRDEGTSYHYLPPSDYAHLSPDLDALLAGAFHALPEPVHLGATWTTDAPFRETAFAVDAARAAGIMAVEMEAAALYAFAEARAKPVICFAHVTNQMGTVHEDFEKGEDDGSRSALALIDAAVRHWSAHVTSENSPTDRSRPW